MISETELLKPTHAFAQISKEHARAAEEYFDELVKKSQIDTGGNEVLMEKYYKKLDKSNSLGKELSKKRGLRGFLIFLVIALIIACVIFSVLGAKETIEMSIAIAVAISCGALAIAFLVIIFAVLNKKIKAQKNELTIMEKELESMREQGYSQCQALNALLDYDMHVDVLNKAFSTFKLEKRFEPSKFQYFHEKFNLQENYENDNSTVHIQSGSILGNPFIVETSRIMSMGTCTYTGTLTITYPVRVSNGKGGYRTTMRTEVLHATVVKEKPYYNYEKVLYFGSDVAPKLSFSRVPSNAARKSEKEIASYVKSEWKKVDSKAKKNVSKGFTPIANEEFETLFHAWDRDNEVEFRLMYTPLAQKNMIELLKSKKPYGDDFIYKKNKKINLVRTEHSQYVDYVCDPNEFVGFDYMKSRDKFINYNKNYFQSLYYDLVPILSVPLFQQLPPEGYIISKKYPGNATKYEAEALVNGFDEKQFAPENSATPIILKSKFISKDGKADIVNVTAHSFSTIEHIALVPTMGGDGIMHNVPVHWLEYVPIEKDTKVTIINKEMSRYDYRQFERSQNYQNFFKKYGDADTIRYSKGYLAVITPGKKSINKEDISELVK